MNEFMPFAISYLDKHTEKATRVLHSLPVENTLAFLESIPPKVGVRVIEKLPPQYTIQCLLELSPERSAVYLGAAKTLTGAGLLRMLPGSFRRAALSMLPEAKRGFINKQLSYPKNVIGAWMDPDCPRISIDSSVGQVRQLLRKAKNEVNHSIPVIGQGGRLEGLLSLPRLARSRAKYNVGKIMTRDAVPFLDRGLLTEASAAGDWDRFDAYPVINPEEEFIGLLTRKSLERGLRSLTGEDKEVENHSLALDGLHAYTLAVQNLVKALVDLFLIRGKRGRTSDHEQ